jgi:diaminopimelate epimerase
MRYAFTKMHGLGNDFVFFDGFKQEYHFTPEQVAFVCDRHFGIGGDGLIVAEPSPKEGCAAYMRYYNADGSVAQMCGNGVRCLAKFVVDRGYVAHPEQGFVLDTLAGEKGISCTLDEDGKLVEATVDMGEPILVPADVPTALPATADYEGTPYVRESGIDNPWQGFDFTCVSMGNPHAITFIEDFTALPDAVFTDPAHKSLASFDVATVGRFYESHEAFPEKANIEFVSVEPDGLHMRVYERGDGETLACGTGACATAVAAHLTGRTNRTVDVHLRGGVLHIDWKADTDHVFMTGTATEAFEGTIELV